MDHRFIQFSKIAEQCNGLCKRINRKKDLGKIISVSETLSGEEMNHIIKAIRGEEHRWRVLNNQAIHHLDAYVWLVGLPSKSRHNRSNRNYIECEDTSVSIFEHSNGIVGTFLATTQTAFEDLEASIEIHGTTGYIKIGGIALNKIEFVRTNT